MSSEQPFKLDPTQQAAWQASMTDPVRDDLMSRDERPQLDHIRSLFPPTVGEPAFDPDLIQRNVDNLRTSPTVNTGHPFLDRSVKVGLAHIDATFQGDHPKYGVKHYADERHDGFPPTIIAAVDALSAWGMHDRAAELLRYWLRHFVRNDGSINYYGPALSEYGQLLHTVALFFERAGGDGWWGDCRPALERLAAYAIARCEQADAADDLVAGVPEADISTGDPDNVSDAAHNESNRYFHNNAWLARGLQRWAGLMTQTGDAPRKAIAQMARLSDALQQRTIQIMEDTWPRDENDWWLSPQVEPIDRPSSVATSMAASYANYRYWPELLSSSVLPERLAKRLVNARLTGGGQFCGMTRLQERLDDWPLADYLAGAWAYGFHDEVRLSLFGHVAYHQAGDHLTAYEQVTLPPCREMSAPYCLVCQLVPARIVPRMQTDARD